MNEEFDYDLTPSQWETLKALRTPASRLPRMSRYTIDGGDLAALSERLAAARAKAGRSGKPVRMLSCYEAGLDAHWLHRWLTEHPLCCTMPVTPPATP